MKHLEDLGQKNRMKFALLFGLLAGLGYAVGAWGIDAVYLFNANGLMPFVKFAVGGSVCVIIGLLAGWLTKLIDNLVASIIIWTASGFAFSWLASRIPFTGMYMIFGYVRPELQNLVNYTLDEGLITRIKLTIGVTLVVSVFAGLLVESFIEESSHAGYPFKRWGPILLWLVAFGGAAFIGDAYLIKPMRESTVILNNLIQYQLDHEDEGISDEVMLNLRLRGLRGISDILHKPRKLIASEYDNQMVAIKVMVDFDGTWARCVMVNNTLGNCKAVE